MGISVETLIAAKKFTSETVLGGGAVVGKNVTISSIIPIDGGNRITFSYTLDNGTKKTSTLDVMNGSDGKPGKDAVSPTITENADNTDKIYKLDVTTVDGTFTTPNLCGKDGTGSSSGEENIIESVSVNGSQITPDENKNVNITIPTVDVTKKYVDNSLEDKADKDHTHTEVNGHTVESDVPTDAKFTDTIYDDSTLKGRISKVEENIGDVTTIKISSVSDLVSAINALYNSFMSGITYADKKLTINYRNGQKTELDLSPIIVDTNLSELSNVDDTGITDGQLLKYDTATSKYIPTTIDTAKVLADAKKYADDEIAKMNHMDAIAVDEKPTYSDGTINYVKNGETLTTENSDLWFYYNVDGMNYQTLFIDGVEFTVSVDGDIDFKDFVSKTNDITDTYTGEETDKTKVANIGALDALYTIVVTALGKKVNTVDIVDSLVSDATDKPLSAAQGKALDEKKLDVEDVVDNLTTTDTDKPLSANQGKVLDNKISEMNKSTKEQFGVVEGSFIHIEDSVDGNATEIGVVGKSTQTHYTGKNILKSTITTGSQNGITCTVNSDGSCTLTGTATADAWLNVNTDIPVTVGTTYKLVGCPKNVSATLIARRVSSSNPYGTDTGDGVTFTPDENAYVFIGVKSGVTLNNAIFRPMITTNLDATYDDFEPYVGGIPSPNPEYPQDITSVGDNGSVIITSCGKNLITYPYYQQSGETNGITWTVNGDGTVTATGTATKESSFNYIYPFSTTIDGKLTVGQTYTFSDGIDEPITGVYSQLVRYNSVTKKFDWSLSTAKGKNKTFTCSDANLIDFGYRTVIDAGVTVENLVIRPQLEIGTEVTEYEKYKESTTTISLSDPLRSIGDIKDEITYQNGKFGVLRRVGKVTVDGVNGKISFVSVNKDTTGVIQCNIPTISNIIKKQVGGKLLCTRFRHSSSWNVGDIENTIYEYQNGAVAVRLPLSVSEITDVATANTYFTTHPFDVLYILNVPTFEKLDQSIPYGVTTYKGITNISNKDNVDMSVKYPLTDSAASGSKNEAKIAELENKVTNDCVSNTVSLQKLIPDGSDVASYVSNQGKTYLRYYTTRNSKVLNPPDETANGYIWYSIDANLIITARSEKGMIWVNPILNGSPTGWKKVCITPVKDISPTKLQLSVPSTQTLTNDQSSYCVVNGVCYLHIAVGWSNTAEMGWHLSSNADMPIPLNYFKSSIAIPEGFVHISVDETDEGGDLNIYCPKLNASRTLYMDFSYPVK